MVYDQMTSTHWEYDHEGKRYTKMVWVGELQRVVEYYFYGIDGKLLATCAEAGGCGHNLYFGGKLLRSKAGRVVTDRLGSVRWQQGVGALNYYPYGEERPVTAATETREKFGTYQRDLTGLDYADQRYYGPGTGRFLTTDPYEASGGVEDPGSWNRYSYVQGDPVNYYDPEGLYGRCPAGTTTGPDGKSCVGAMVEYSFEDDDGSAPRGGSASQPGKGELPTGGGGEAPASVCPGGAAPVNGVCSAMPPVQSGNALYCGYTFVGYVTDPNHPTMCPSPEPRPVPQNGSCPAGFALITTIGSSVSGTPTQSKCVPEPKAGPTCGKVATSWVTSAVVGAIANLGGKLAWPIWVVQAANAISCAGMEN
jgi:RHS repeat-associated protein